MMRLCINVLLVAAALVSVVLGGPVKIDQYWAGPNRILSLDYRDGTLAIGTETAGLWVVREGELVHLDRNNGLLENSVRNVALLDSRTLFVGPTLHEGEWCFLEVVLRDSGPEVGRIPSPDPAFYFYPSDEDVTHWAYRNELYVEEDRQRHRMVGVAPDGSLWVGDAAGLRRWDGSSWLTYRWPEEASYKYDGRICISDSGSIWGVTNVCFDVSGHLFFRFDPDGSSAPEGRWTIFHHVARTSAVGIDQAGRVWSISKRPPGLWRWEEGQWCLISDDPDWGLRHFGCPAEYGELAFDGQGRLYAAGRRSLLRWDSGSLTVVTSACGVTFDGLLQIFFPSMVMCGDKLLLGTYGAGLLIFDVATQSFSRFFQAGIPGNWVMHLSEDSQGTLWVMDWQTFLFGRFDGRVWDQIDGAFPPHWYWRNESAVDALGRLWFTFPEGAVRWEGDERVIFDSSNSPLERSAQPVVDSSGTVWLLQEDVDGWEPGPAQVVSFNGKTWQEYGRRGFFRDYRVHHAIVGPNDSKWFYVGDGYFVFDGAECHFYRRGDAMPPWGPTCWHIESIRFELNGQLILCGCRKICWGMLGGPWNWLVSGTFSALQLDSDGKWWLGTGEGLVCRDGDEWKAITVEDGLSHASVTTILIDHNGDKWVGTKHGLNRIEDGGAAQQKLGLLVEDSGGYVTLIGRFVNAGAVIPVLLWLGCECDGTIFYYPDWSTTPTPVKMVLGAYSVEEKELLRLQKSSLPPGDYAFIGGISLLGGIDLLIGPRDSKLTVACYHKP